MGTADRNEAVGQVGEAGGVLGLLDDVIAMGGATTIHGTNQRTGETYAYDLGQARAAIAELFDAAIEACLRPHAGARSYHDQMNRLYAAIHAMRPDGIEGPFAHGVPESLDAALRAVGAAK